MAKTNKTRTIINHFRKNDPVMFSMAKRIGIVPVTRRADYFNDLCYAIIGQQLSSSVAKTIYGRFEKLFPNGITPERAARMKESSLRGIGTSWAKASYIIDLGQRVSRSELDLKKIAKLENQQAIAELTKVKGIGPWTAEMFLMFTMGREDVFSHGDLGLQKAIMKHYRIKKLDKKKVEKISAKWSPYRTYACRVLWKSLEA